MRIICLHYWIYLQFAYGREYLNLPFVQGIPDSDEVKNKLSELIPDESILEVDLKTDLDEEKTQFGIEIPEIYEQLKSEGLM